MKFFVGIQEPASARLFLKFLVNVNRLRKRKSYFPIHPTAQWLIDPSAWGTLSKHGHYPFSVAQYAAELEYWQHCGGQFLGSFALDWLCTPKILEKTGLTIEESQHRTIAWFDELTALTTAPVIPVLQGQQPWEYVRHLGLWGHRIPDDALVGVGSLVGKLPEEIETILIAIKLSRPRLRLHGLGVKLPQLKWRLIRECLWSADSASWSVDIWRNDGDHNDHRHGVVYGQKVQLLLHGDLSMTDLTHYLTHRKHRERVNDLIEAIALLQKLEAEQRRPTAEERFKLLCYPGTGAVPKLFTTTKAPQWEETARETVKGLLSKVEYDSIRDVILNQHHTDPRLIAILWEALQAQGFNGGTVLEPGCSIGLFAEYMPPALQKTTRLVGVEKDRISYRIAKLLHPQHQFYNQPLQLFRYPDNRIDAALGNPPFSDGSNPKDIDGIAMNQASYAIARAICHCKPGAPIILIVGIGVLDNIGNAKQKGESDAIRFRRWVDQQAVFRGAIRLPAETFTDIADTSAPADIIILRKRWDATDTEPSAPFIGVEPSSVISEKTKVPARINQYFIKHPHRILGTPCLDKTTGDRFSSTWAGSLDDLFAAVREQLQSFCREDWKHAS